MSWNKHHWGRGFGKYVSASERAPKMEESIISESKSKVGEVESDEEDSDFDC